MNEYTGKVIKKFKALPEEYEYLQDMASGCNKPTFQFLLHVTASTLLKLKELPEERFSPIYCKLIRENFGRNVNWRLLRERQIIEVKPYCRESGRSRQFKLADWVVANLLE